METKDFETLLDMLKREVERETAQECERIARTAGDVSVADRIKERFKL
jgi:hypothetical protein